MRIGPFGVWEIMIILVVVLLVFGPRRLPEMAKGLGQSVRAFRKEIRGLKDDIDATPAAPEPAPAGDPAAQSTAAVTAARPVAPSAPSVDGERAAP